MDTILVVNAGSSSLKFQVFAANGTEELRRLVKGQIEGIGTRPRLRAQDMHQKPLVDHSYAANEVADVRELETSSDPRAALALDYFAYRVGLHTGMLAAALGGLDAFVFTAGMGENSAALRARIADKLGWLGAALDRASNAAPHLLISHLKSRVALFVIPTDEELMIARHTLSLLSQSGRRQRVYRRKSGPAFANAPA